MNARRLGVWANLAISAGLALLVWVLLVWVASRPGLRSLRRGSRGSAAILRATGNAVPRAPGARECMSFLRRAAAAR